MSDVRVLLLEDSPTDSELVQLLLEEGMPEAQVVAVATLADALREARTGPEVLLADLTLPDADGLDVVRALRAAAPDSALVVLTGRADGEMALEALAAGAQEYLVKGQDDAHRLSTALRHALQRHTAERRARRFEQLAHSLLDALEAPTCAVDRDGRITAVNRAWREMAEDGGLDPGLVGPGVSYLDACEAVPEDAGDDCVTAVEVAAGLRAVLDGTRERYVREYPCHSPTQERWYSMRISPAAVGGEPGAVITHVDVTQLQLAKEALTHQALHDALTDLPNRLLLTDRLDQALSDCARRGTRLAVAFLDLDGFKRINDSLGHAAGDELLSQVGTRLRASVRAGDTLGRFAGDEFVVVWRDLSSDEEAEQLSARLCAALSAPFDIDGTSVKVTASVGVAVGAAPQTPDELLLAADAAMYDAKGHGRGRVRLFTQEMRRGASERMATEVALREAVERDQLVVHYQPVVDVATGRPVSVEALVRWEHPERGLLAPDTFIPVAEASGLIVPLGRVVLERACREAASWTGAAAQMHVAVNLSTRQLIQPDVLSHVRTALSNSGLQADRLLLEVTESAVMEDAEAAGVALEALTDLGVRIAIDDFGTGYSSLLYLRRYPIRALKVDRAFVAGVATVPDDAAIVASVVSLAHAVGAASIAEGVETPAQWAALRGFGCQQAQGYLWSRPVPAEELPDALRRCLQVPVPGPSSAGRVPAQRVDSRTAGRITSMHEAGASLHTIAAALNREGAPNPAGVRWHAHAVARYVAKDLVEAAG